MLLILSQCFLLHLQLLFNPQSKRNVVFYTMGLKILQNATLCLQTPPTALPPVRPQQGGLGRKCLFPEYSHYSHYLEFEFTQREKSVFRQVV